MTKKEALKQEVRIDRGSKKGWEEFPSLSPYACVLERGSRRDIKRESDRATP